MADTARREFMLGEGAGTGGGSQNLKVNLGPSHPAMHGIIRITAELDGEVIVNADVEIGYLHRAPVFSLLLLIEYLRGKRRAAQAPSRRLTRGDQGRGSHQGPGSPPAHLPPARSTHHLAAVG